MSTEPSPAVGGDAEATEQHGQRRRQRRTVFAVAMAVLLAGGGGAYWASTAGNSGGAPASGGKPPQLALDGLGTAQGAGGEKSPDGKNGEGKSGPGILPGEPTNAQPYRAEPGTLPDGSDSAAVHRPAGPDRADVAALAKALDVPGGPEKERDRWTVGTPGKGSEPSLTVDTGANAGNWTYTRDSSATPPVKGDPVSEAKAKDAADPALKALKLSGAKVTADATGGSTRIVEAAPRIADLPVQGWDSSFIVGPDGKLLRGHGQLTEMKEGASYPLQSAKETLRQLNDRRPALPKGAKPEPVKVSGAELGLAAHQSNGKPVLVPSWLYDVKPPGGGSPEPVAHPAVSAKYLQPSERQGGPMPLPEPVEPGGKDPSAEPDEPGGQEKPGKDEGHEIGAGGGSADKAVRQAVSSYRTDGRTLKLTFWGGVCDTYKATAEESAKSVRVTVAPKHPDEKKVCVKMAKRQSVEVQLDKPLDGRKVVDTRSGKSLPTG